MKIHIAGLQITVGTLERQLCAWCGEKLVDHDAANIAVAPGSGKHSSFWKTGALVARDGPGTWIVAHADGDQLPLQACASQAKLTVVK